MNKKATLLWVDIEMTGLDPIEDRVLEIAAIATDWDFKEIAVYNGIVKVGPRLIEKRMVKGPSADFWNSVPKVRDALITQNLEQGRSGRTIENELLVFLETHFGDNTRVILAGNSIHQDRKFIDREWPRFAAKLHYRMLDVTAWKVVFDGKYKKRFTKTEVHRALDDIRGSIEELQYYLKKVKS